MKADRFYIISYVALNDNLSLVAALRPYRLAEFLRKNNLQAEVITPRYGAGLERVIPEGKLLSKLKFLLKIFPPDYSIFWSLRLFFALRKEWKKDHFYLLTTCPPYGLGTLGLLLKLFRYRFTWICDFRDLWLGNPLYNPPFTKKYFNPLFEKSFYKKSDIMVFNTAWDLNYNCTRYPFLKEKSIYVRNGFDEVRSNDSENSFKFIYAGGTTKGEATPHVKGLLASLNAKGVSASCDFYGEYDSGLENDPFVRYRGKLSPDEISELLTHYKFGFIYLPKGCEEGGRVAQKFYDYIGSGVIPICIRPSQEMANMMDSLGVGIKITNDTPIEVITSSIQTARFNVKPAALTGFTRMAQFEKLLERLKAFNH